MRVLHVIDALGLGGGAEQALATQLPLLGDHGVESEVICLYDREVGLFERVRADGFRVDVLGVSSWAKGVAPLRRAIRERKPDLVHSTLIHACLATRLAMRRLPTAQLNSVVNTTYDPVRIEVQGLDPRKVAALRRFDSVTARRLGGHFHALTQTVADEVVSVLGVPVDRVTVIPRGRDLGSFAPVPGARDAIRGSLDVGPDVPLVLTIGRQDPQKAHGDLVAAVADARGRGTPLELVIVGREGSATPALEASIDRHDAAAWTHVVGHRTDVPDLFAASDIFCLPSHYEGLGSVLIEAMAAGVPIVGSDAPAIAEVLGGGQRGLVARRSDPADLADKLVAATDTEAMAPLIEEALGHARSRYALGAVVAQTAGLYERLAAGG